MSTVDYGFFEALTGPMQAAGRIQEMRDQRKLQEFQIAQQQRQMELAQLDKQKALQSQLNTATEAAKMDLYTKNNFSRQKDIDDFRNWHNTMSGWGDIQEILRQHGSVDNARLYGNLDYLLEEYKAKLKDNPVSRRVNKNKASLELYHAYALDKDKNDRFLTKGSKERYKQFLDGTTDNFIFYGGRQDYLNESIKARNSADAINLDDVLYDNYSAILADMINDSNAEPGTQYTDSQMKAWLANELNVTPSGGVDYFNGQAMFGEKEIDTDFGSELKRMTKETNKTGIVTGKQFFDNLNLKDGETFHKLFNETGLAKTWNRFGGYDATKQTKSYVGTKAIFGKGRQVASGGQVFVDKNIEDKISEILFGKYQDSDISKYVSKNRKIYDVGMVGAYDSRGHQITSQDTSDIMPGETGFEDWVGEDEKMDLKLNGYFVALRGTGADGKSILLTDVTNKEDRTKLSKEYKDVVFQPVIVAEMEDFDLLSHNDVYYKELDLGDANVLMSLNEQINPEKLNEVLGQSGSYEQQMAREKMIAKRQMVANAKLQRQLNMPNPESVEDLVSGYDQTLTVGLGLSRVPAVKIQQAVPMIMSDLFVASQQERTYPYDFNPQETDPSKKMIAQNPGQYMAYSAKILQEGLIGGNPAFEAMLTAIKTGNYDEYSQTQYNEKDYKNSRKITKGIIQYQRGR
tara:strand:+ start:9160 stop:11220 length:2061 start_codon:yes stop_codon:yes gene_type:complete